MWNRLKEPAPEIDEYGGKYWCNNAGKVHRDNDMPAVIYEDGSKEWYVNGLRHRDNDLPAVIFKNGYKAWYVNGELIRSEL